MKAKSNKCSIFVVAGGFQHDALEHQVRELRDQLFDSLMVVADPEFQTRFVDMDVQVPLRHVDPYVHWLAPISGGCCRPPWRILSCRSIRARALPAVRILQVWPTP